jgi:hypothetical protein
MDATGRGAASNTLSVKLSLLLIVFLASLATTSLAERLVITLTLPQEEKKEEQKIWVVSVVREGAEVFASPSTRSRLYYKCPKDMLLAVKEEEGEWLGVIMIDGSLGWIRKNDTRKLPYVSDVILHIPGNLNKFSNTKNDTLEQKIVKTALSYLGVPYRWGGLSSRGMDCSGFVQRVFSSNGIALPRTAEEQFRVGRAVPLDQLQIADRLYFASRNGRIDHTGIYIGSGLFIHSARSRGGVSIDSINDPKWRNMFVGAKRL